MRARPVREVAWFFAIFAALWTLSLIIIWKDGALSGPARPLFRTGFWCLAALAFVLWQRPKRPLAWLGLSGVSLRGLAIGLLAAAALLAWNWLRLHVMSHAAGPSAEFTTRGLAWGFIGVFVEELVFRGVIQTRLADAMAPPLAVIIAALLFLAIHLPGWLILGAQAGVATAASVFLLGVICGALRQWTGSLWPGVAVHWANNFGAFL